MAYRQEERTSILVSFSGGTGAINLTGEAAEPDATFQTFDGSGFQDGDTTDLVIRGTGANSAEFEVRSDATFNSAGGGSISRDGTLELGSNGASAVDFTAGDVHIFTVPAAARWMALLTDTAANTAHAASTSNPHSVTKSQVGLGSVDNTSDADKPVSTATQTALDAKQAADADLTTLSTAFTSASASGPASLALAEDTDNGAHTVTVIAPASVASDKVATLQDVTGTIYVTGGSDVAVADGGTGASTAADARTNLGVPAIAHNHSLAEITDEGALAALNTVGTSQIDNDAVTDGKLRNSGALSVIGRAANSSGDPADIAASASSAAVLRESGSTLGFGTVASAGIADAAITNAKLANMAASTVKGRSGSTGAPQDLTLGANLVISGGVLSMANMAALSVKGRSANSSGAAADIAASAASGAVLRESGSTIGFGTIATAGIADAAVTSAKLRNSGALSVIGRSANSSGVPADVSASAASGAVLRESGSTLGFGTIATAGIANSAVTYAKIQNVAAQYRVLGRISSGAGVAEEMTPDNLFTVLAQGTSSLIRFGAHSLTLTTTATTNATFPAGTTTLASLAGTGTPVEILIAVSDETTALTTGTAKATFRMPYAMTLTSVRASVTTAPTGSVLTVDINEGGSTILSTKLTIDATEKTSTTAATPAVISDSTLADDAEITVDIDGIGSTIAGAGLKILLKGTRA